MLGLWIRIEFPVRGSRIAEVSFSIYVFSVCNVAQPIDAIEDLFYEKGNGNSLRTIHSALCCRNMRCLTKNI